MALELRGLCPLLQVYDMPTSVRFYCDLLGFEMVSHAPFYAPGEFHWCWLRRGDIELMLNTAYDEGQRPPAPDPARIAAHNDTCLYLGCPDVGAAWEHLTALGLQVQPPNTAPYGMRQLYFEDPDGFSICFQSKA
jgi:catechol 2,3-dioxygenase-like lactoylglutathione lyase family enzyme